MHTYLITAAPAAQDLEERGGDVGRQHQRLRLPFPYRLLPLPYSLFLPFIGIRKLRHHNWHPVDGV
jgi:hypothetical protein